jgi:16S rRNA C967 or C1407 C5-methylase (RsmB/RsmF family)
VALVAQSLKKAGIADTQPTPVLWLPGFYSLPVATPLARTNLYKEGELYGIDISSGYAVTLLNIQPGEHVLDLCCAPGAKLTMIADLLELSGSVTGVDFSRQRIGACKQLVHKYKLIKKTAVSASEEAALKKGPSDTSENDTTAEKDAPTLPVTSWRCRLFHADGRTFNIGPKTECEQLEDIETVLDTEEIAARGNARGQQQRKRKNKRARARDAKRLKVDVVHDAALYDKVLVDAECTHDGSIRHLQKNDSLEKWMDYVENHLSDSNIERILKLQHALIR